MNSLPFKNQVVIVTGASMGIGCELARQLARQGGCVALAARSAGLLEQTAQECRALGGQAIAVPTDVGDPAHCQNLVEQTVKQFGRIDMLINNAGIAQRSRFDELSALDQFEKVMRVNFMGCVYCTYWALPHLKTSHGRFVTVSSGSGKFPAPPISSYCASKYALDGFCSTLRMELAGNGVSVTMIYPGWVSTGISTRAVDKDGRPFGKIHSREIGAMSVEVCARQILRAAARRRRELIMGFPTKLGLLLHPIFPEMVERFAASYQE